MKEVPSGIKFTAYLPGSRMVSFLVKQWVLKSDPLKPKPQLCLGDITGSHSLSFFYCKMGKTPTLPQESA